MAPSRVCAQRSSHRAASAFEANLIPSTTTGTARYLLGFGLGSASATPQPPASSASPASAALPLQIRFRIRSPALRPIAA